MSATDEQVSKARQLRQQTTIFLVVCSLFLIAWDVKVATNDVKGDTISELLRDASYDSWLLPFMVMGVMGHLFWNRPEGERESEPALLVGSCVALGVIDLGRYLFGAPVLHYANLLSGVAGFGFGALWWPQLNAGVQAVGDAAGGRLTEEAEGAEHE